MASKYIGIPKEPSAAGFMLVSTIYGLAVAKAGVREWSAGILLVLLHMFTFDPILNAARTWDLRDLFYLGIVNALPYFCLLVLGVKTLALSLAVSVVILGSHFLLVNRRKWRDPYVYITGSAIPVLAALNIPVAVTNALRADVFVLWLLSSIYVMATSAYIESVLPYREFDPKVALTLWLPAFIPVLYNIFLVIPIAEPTVKFLVQIKNPKKIKATPHEIRRLGWREFARFMVYCTLLIIILKLT
ncbi:MAG: hypothetical protein F7B59_07590 [Desulfurococcales archaeon]|nr:hypothetical protein [Desulfurococcales archaeon]